MKNNAAMEDHWSNNPRFKEALAEQTAQQDMPKIGCVNHDCDKCKAQQQQEPVAWLKVIETPGGWGKFVEAKPHEKGAKPVYTSPPAQPWVGLTDEEIHKMTVLMGINPEWKAEMEIVRSVVRNLEAKLREKNA